MCNAQILLTYRFGLAKNIIDGMGRVGAICSGYGELQSSVQAMGPTHLHRQIMTPFT